MNALHLLNRTHAHPAFNQCLSAAPGNTILLMEDAVYELQDANSPLWRLTGTRLLALEPDILARGVTPANAIESLSYDDFVLLTTQHCPIVSWY
ncbi:sulfurtransferase complex subunit TusB [Simiduia sp. 21SJ11W-1]|uniref:sulfurtransferase complex subunit TusB n=1 Tax=Simiduia sp. 21SJ11W-1 TaxID=2909669 RepID=UPI00209F17DB|nr:sulfurtransferase complex subunit TusB [Simiduia sp. 21SJ11W-1]UTA46354.1 sulfurtransferase complex subunit TusB [Simiduia sp. 21SJ11W-1]